MAQSKKTAEPKLFDANEVWVPNLVAHREARGREWAGFSEIRFTANAIEADYVVSNGRMSTKGTFTYHYKRDDDMDKLVGSINKMLGDAFLKFERLGKRD